MASAIPTFGSFDVVIETKTGSMEVAASNAKLQCEVEMDKYLREGAAKNFPLAHMLFTHRDKHYRLDVIPVWVVGEPNGMRIPLTGTCVEIPIEEAIPI